MAYITADSLKNIYCCTARRVYILRNSMYFAEKKNNQNITQQASHSVPHRLKKNVPELKYYSLFAPEGTKSDLLLAGLPTKIQVEYLFGTVPVLACLTGE